METLFLKSPHCAMISGATGCGKTAFVLTLLKSVYKNHFDYIIIFCPTIRDNQTYLDCKFIWEDDCVYLVNPENKLSESLDRMETMMQKVKHDHDRTDQKDFQALFIIDDCSAEKSIVQKRHALSKLSFSGRHIGISVWILTQKYNSVLTDFREQLKWVVLFYSKDRDSYENCLKENDVIESREERTKIKEHLKTHKHSKLFLKTSQPTGYKLLT